MLDKKYLDDPMDTLESPLHCECRNGGERRRKASPGYACITIVGWICRREQVRRKNDSLSFFGRPAGDDGGP